MNLKKIAVGVALALGTVSGAALAGTATFTGAFSQAVTYSEAGIDFTTLYPGGHLHVGDVYADAIFNHNGGCCTDPTQISQTGGGLFTLSSLDVLYTSGGTTLVGSNAAVYTVTGTGTINFGSLFAGVTEVTWYDSGNSDSAFDNVTINAIPEPETYAMLLAGLGLLGFAARRRKQKLAAA